MITLTNSILNKYPEADRKVVQELNDLVEKYNITWVPSKEGNSAWFIMSDLSIAKGLDVEDYRRNWTNLTTGEEERSSKTLPGEAFKLEGQKLKNFKDIYQQTTGKSLGRVNSLWVGDWFHAYSYLVQGLSDAAKDFQGLGASTIQKVVIQEIGEVTKEHRYSFGLSEGAIQDQLAVLSLHTLRPFEIEVSIKDFPQSKCDVRRLDLVRWFPHRTFGKIVHVYELKKDIITLEDLIQTTEAKRYRELAQQHYKTECVLFYMVAPWGGTTEAHLKAAELGVEILTVQQLSLQLFKEAYKKHPYDRYFVTDMLAKKFEKILTNPVLPPLPSEDKKVIPLPVKKAAA